MKRIDYLSYIRVAACLAIILLHTVDAAIIMYGDLLTTQARTASLSIVHCMMWAVPCFVMVTGALLLDKNKSIGIKDVFLKYILRILIALCAFSLIFALFDMLMNRMPFSFNFILTAAKNVVTGNGWAHLWYLYLLIGIYLLLIFYKMIAANASSRQLKYLLIVYFIFLSILPLAKMINIQIGFYILVSTIYPFFLFAGYAISSGKIKINKVVCILFALIGIAGMVVSTILDGRTPLISAGNLLGYSSVFVVLLALAVFTGFKYIWGRKSNEEEEIILVAEHSDIQPEIKGAKKNGAIKRFVLQLDRCSFGIYLIHMIFIRLVFRYWGLNPYAKEPTFLIFAGVALAIFFVSFGITYLLKMIPGVRKIL